MSNPLHQRINPSLRFKVAANLAVLTSSLWAGTARVAAISEYDELGDANFGGTERRSR
jgi:hypothetical protein